MDSEGEQCVVTSTDPGVGVGCGEERVDLVGSEVAHGGLVLTLGRHGEHALDQLGVFGVSQGGIAEERTDRGQAGVAGGHAVVAVAFKMGQEGGDQGRVQVGEIELGRCRAGVLAGEAEQETERVSVGGNGVGAGVALGGEPIGEERFDRRGDGAHRYIPTGCSSR